jgi:hypothetical protein
MSIGMQAPAGQENAQASYDAPPGGATLNCAHRPRVRGPAMLAIAAFHGIGFDGKAAQAIDATITDDRDLEDMSDSDLREYIRGEVAELGLSDPAPRSGTLEGLKSGGTAVTGGYNPPQADPSVAPPQKGDSTKVAEAGSPCGETSTERSRLIFDKKRSVNRAAKSKSRKLYRT